MKELKCPICGNVLEQSDGFHEPFMCLNCQINMKHNQWQELIRTRKALDVARHAIGWINQMIDEHTDKQAIKIKCEYALDQIKQITETKGLGV